MCVLLYVIVSVYTFTYEESTEFLTMYVLQFKNGNKYTRPSVAPVVRVDLRLPWVRFLLVAPRDLSRGPWWWIAALVSGRFTLHRMGGSNVSPPSLCPVF